MLHLFDPATGVLVVVSANSDTASDDLFELAVSVWETLHPGSGPT